MRMMFHVEYDVVVVGGGVAGVAAALAAARRGRRTALIEKQILLGGLATSGLIYIYLPLCDGEGTQVTFGIAEELLRLSLKYSPFDVPPYWDGDKTADKTKRYQCDFSPAGFTLSLDEALKTAGVDVWLDTLVCATRVEEGRAVALEVENLSGRGLVKGGCFVDGSGDAVVVRKAGLAVETGVNYVTPWIMRRGPGESAFGGNVAIKGFGNYKDPAFDAGDPLAGRNVSAFARRSWQLFREHCDQVYAQGEATRHELFPVHLPAMAQFRKIARIHGKATLTDGQESTRFEDSIGLYADWMKVGSVWETPYGALLPEGLGNVLAAGRCISATGHAWDVFRVIPAAAMTGEAAGVAAAMAVERGVDPDELPVADVQAQLRRNGLKLHLDEIFPLGSGTRPG